MPALVLLGVLLAHPASALVRYVDAMAGTCSGTSYSVSLRTCGGSDGPSYANVDLAEAGTTAGSSDVVYVRGDGEIHTLSDDRWALTKSGASCAAPIIWAGYPGEAPVLNFSIEPNGADNRYFTGASASIAFHTNGDHPTISGKLLIVDGTDVPITANPRGIYQNSGASSCLTFTGLAVTNWLWAGIYLSNCTTCAVAVTHVENIGAADNVVDHGDGIYWSGTSTGSGAQYVVIDDVEDDGYTCSGTGQTLLDSYISDVNKPSLLVSGAHPDGVEGTSCAVVRTRIRNTRNAHIIQARDSTPIIVGNVFDQEADWEYGNDQLQMSGVASALIAYNTSDNATSSFLRLLTSPIDSTTDARNVQVYANIISDPTDVPIDIGVDNAVGFAADYNLYHGMSGSNIINLEGSLKTLATAQALGYEANAPASADPLFTSEAGFDYTLQATSPAINVGNPALVFTPDVAGVARDTLPDLGAYERAGAPPPAENTPRQRFRWRRPGGA